MISIEEIYKLYLKCGGQVVTDTRKIDQNNSGALFFALSGANFNGNSFADQALQKGCQFAIVDDSNLTSDPRFINVDNVLESLQQLAIYHRQRFNGIVLAITGSNGKTTTKELIRACLSSQYNVHATKGNLNNHIGVPLTLLELRNHHDIAVIEMGTNNPGEIIMLANIAQANAALITSIGKAHLEGLGSLEGVAKEKLSLFDCTRKAKGLLFAHMDTPQIRSNIDETHDDVIPYDQHSSLGFDVEITQEFPILKGFLSTGTSRYSLESSLFGRHNLTNIIAAITVGFHYGVSIPKMLNSIRSLKLQNNRTETIQIGDVQYYLDAYNANPSSMNEAINAFGHAEGSQKLIILGDMFELGENEDLEHQDIVELASQFDWDIVLVGSIFNRTKVKSTIKKFLSFEDLHEWFRTTTLSNREVLIKGSRGMGLERLLAEYRTN